MSEIPPISKSAYKDHFQFQDQDPPINIVPFLFPLHIEPDYEAFRIDYCDRLLTELYSAKRDRQIQEFKRTLQNNEPLFKSNDCEQERTGEVDREDLTNYKIIPGSEELSPLKCSPVTTPTMIQTKKFIHDDESNLNWRCMECPSFLSSPSFSMFRSPSTAGYRDSPKEFFSPTDLVEKHNFPIKLYQKTRSKDLSISSEQGFNDGYKFTKESEEKLHLQKVSTEWSSSNFDSEEIEDDEDIRLCCKKSPALRYGRNSGLRRLEDFRKRIKSFQASEQKILEDEIAWELRLGPYCPIWKSINHSEAKRKTVEQDASTWDKYDLVWQDSKLFHFGGKWWRLQFGTKVEVVDIPTESRFFFINIIPAELLQCDIILCAEFRLHPPMILHDRSGQDDNEKQNQMVSMHSKTLSENIYFSSHLQSSSSTNSTPKQCEEFISWKEFLPYVTSTGTVKLSVLLKTTVDDQGNLIGCPHFEQEKLPT